MIIRLFQNSNGLGINRPNYDNRWRGFIIRVLLF
jgi:hypothetical protein